MKIEYLSVLVHSIEAKQKNKILNKLSKQGFVVNGFNDLRKVNDDLFLSTLNKSRKDLKRYLKVIEEVYLSMEIDKLKLRDKQYIETITNTENAQGILATILNNNEDDDEIIEYVLNHFFSYNIIDRTLDNTIANETLNNSTDEIKDILEQINEYKNEIDDLRKQNKSYKLKTKQISDELNNSKTSGYSKDQEIVKLKQRNKEYTDEISNNKKDIDILNKQINSLQNQYDSQKENWNKLMIEHEELEKVYIELKNNYDKMILSYSKKNILIIGLEFEVYESSYINITFNKEEILEDGEEINNLLNSYYQVWIILNEISSYPLKRKINKLAKVESRVKSFNNPSELNEHIKEHELNGIF